MRLEYTPEFLQHWKQRIKGNTQLVKSYFELTNALATDSFEDIVMHSLHGSMLGLHAINLDNDMRIICSEIKEGLLFIDIGSHQEVYYP